MKNATATMYLTSYTLSLLGNSIAAVALPLLVLSITGSILGAGVLAAATAIPAVLAGIIGGVIIDRMSRKLASVAADLVSALAIAALPIVDLVTGLDLGWFIALGILGAIGDMPGMTAREAMLPAIVRHSGVPLERLMGVRESISALVILVGPASAGILMSVFDGSIVLWITAATSLLAALTSLMLPAEVGRAKDAAPSHPLTARRAWRELGEGLDALFRRNPFVLAVTVLSLAQVVVIAALQSLVLPVHFVAIGEEGNLGFVLSALGAGFLIGAVLFSVFAVGGNRRGWFIAGMLGSLVGLAVMGALPATWLLLAGAVVLGISASISGTLLGVLMVERIPEALRGRITGTQNSLMSAAAPAAILLAAVLIEGTDLSVAAIVITAVWVAIVAVALAAPVFRKLEPMTPEPENA